jgi:hypothetical protein
LFGTFCHLDDLSVVLIDVHVIKPDAFDDRPESVKVRPQILAKILRLLMFLVRHQFRIIDEEKDERISSFRLNRQLAVSDREIVGSQEHVF